MSEQQWRAATTQAVALALGLSASSVRAYARAGRIPSRQTPGLHYRFNIEEVRQVLAPPEVQFMADLPSIDLDEPAVFVGSAASSVDPIADPDVLGRLSAQAAFSSIALYEPSTPTPVAAIKPDAGADALGRLVSYTGQAAVAVLARA
ncbi:helix-turn-helix domain-containing protein [Streptomyces sp. H27-D2]|uniref:helix-turn-helix domain-containing protein n=1 Tax=Streptomyces sp. H27-D2 TaxID=3046304 RepID=UPI003FA6FC8B